VLRRPPLGHVLPTAHDMAREHTVLSALSKAGLPVPEPVLLCTDPEPIGAPFYLMRYVDGADPPRRRRARGARAPPPSAGWSWHWSTRLPTCMR
jgi:aminoglycoside phosphotransferase (APT) family kinase protein